MRTKSPGPPSVETVEAERACLRDALAATRRRTGIDVTLGGLATGRTLLLSDFCGTRTGALRGLLVRHGAGMGGRVLATRRPVAVDDYAVDSGISHDYNHPVVVEGLRSAAAMPVIVDSEVVAVLYAATRKPHTLGDRTLPVLRAAADQLGRELGVRREVERRVAGARRQQQQAAQEGALTGAALEDIRQAHAHLCTLAHAVTDETLRDRLEQVTHMLARAVAQPPRPGNAMALTPRELDALAVVAQGCTTVEVATRLAVSPETIKTHLRSAARKLGTHSRHETVIQARRLGLLP